MRAVQPTTKKIARLVVVLFACIFTNFAFAQSTVKADELKSRVSVVTEASQTKVWASDFPKNTSVVIFDNEMNLLSVTTTNTYGAAFITLSTSIDRTVYVKTLNGEISVTNQPILKAGNTDVASTSKSQKA